MLLSWFNLMFLFYSFTGSMIAVSSSSWLACWLGLELNLLSVIPIMMMKSSTNSSESSIKYFMVQAMSSVIFISASLFLLYSSSIFFSNQMNSLITIALAIKMGAAPFHFWFPQIIDMCAWPISLFIMTWQKVAPMFIMSFCQTKMIFIIVIMSALTGALGAINQLKLKKIMAYSSIAHLSWLIMALMMNIMLWEAYFITYTIMITNIIFIFLLMNMNYVNDLSSQPMTNIIKTTLAFNIFSLAGLPPFLGFTMKIMVIDYILSNNLFIVSVFLIMSSIISLYFYSRMNYTFMFYSQNPLKLNMTNHMKMPIMLSMISILMNVSAPFYFICY